MLKHIAYYCWTSLASFMSIL